MYNENKILNDDQCGNVVLILACTPSQNCLTCPDGAGLCGSCAADRYLRGDDQQCVLPDECDDSAAYYKDDTNKLCTRTYTIHVCDVYLYYVNGCVCV